MDYWGLLFLRVDQGTWILKHRLLWSMLEFSGIFKEPLTISNFNFSNIVWLCWCGFSRCNSWRFWIRSCFYISLWRWISSKFLVPISPNSQFVIFALILCGYPEFRNQSRIILILTKRLGSWYILCPATTL